MHFKTVAFIVIFFTNFKICHSRRYDRYTLYHIVPTEQEHIKFLQNLDTQKYIDFVFWKKPSRMHEDVQLIVNPNDKELFLERAEHFKLKVEMLLPDVQVAFDNQSTKRYMRLRAETYSWNGYHTLEDIYQWLVAFSVFVTRLLYINYNIFIIVVSMIKINIFKSVLNCEYILICPTHSDIKSMVAILMLSIGKSAEGRDIYALTLQKSKVKSSVIVEGGIHGHEWISTEFVLYLANQLIHANGSYGRLKDLSERYIWHFIPLVNPDGYEYSHNEDRLWRKNRRVMENNVGVDLNRNFPYSFGSHGASYDPSDENYCGPNPLSEPETIALSNFVSSKKNNLRFYFAFHAYGQKIIIPFADRVKHLGNYGEMENYSKQAIMKMYYRNGVKYRVGTVYDTLGTRISGNSASWMKSTYKVKYVFTILLRDNGTFGYALPVEQIEPACEEALTGMVEMMTAKPRHIVLFGHGSRVLGSYLLLYLLAMVSK
ncbi:hypothetical protein K1T71_010647 [Dendrolimus kikuchii]|uniref:Uncharacterized protein n=1 Tax=Dendrolimus kikuchii TaxID=765133 RepID=A0ACC1CPI4_9NEOP|nr:hypothetical protein K1T71_010647 [Dendrolimus kikuchii]